MMHKALKRRTDPAAFRGQRMDIRLSPRQWNALQRMAEGAVIRVDENRRRDGVWEVKLCIPTRTVQQIGVLKLPERVTVVDYLAVPTVQGLQRRGFVQIVTPLCERGHGRWELTITGRGKQFVEVNTRRPTHLRHHKGASR